MRTILLSTFFILALAVLAFTFYSTSTYRTPGEYAETTVNIEPRTGVVETLNQLHDAGVLPPLVVTALPVILSQQYSSLKAGEYHFLPGLTPAQVIAQIVRGDIVVHKITIPEGWTMYQVRLAFMNEPLLAGELPAQIPEGSILPDTMRFTRGEARKAVLVRMQKAQTDLLAKLWNGREQNLPINSPQEAVTLASVVERETGVVDERAMVAGVFVNRLRVGQMLQSDPTVAYGVEMRQGGMPMGRPLSRTDLVTDTPFNSYMHTGLPPTPICNPGKAALEAVLHPAATDALYFVATGTGGHNFASTLAGHEKNVDSYHAAMHDEPTTPAKVVKPVKVQKPAKMVKTPKKYRSRH